jgi:ankyrin repeat protein
VLCAVVIERLIEDHANNVDLSYAYYYFDFRDREKQNALNFISSLCGQLCHWLDPIPKEVVLLYQTCHRGMQRPVITRLLSLFKGLVMKLKEVFIVIDAIDECPKGSDREGLLQALTTIKGFRLSNLHIMVSSRMESDIDNRLRCLITSPTMSLTNPSVNSDISRYIQHFIDSEPKLCRWPQHIKNDIQYSLSEQSRGMFRWVFCQLDILKKCLSVRDIQTALRTLPKTLEETYARILETVPEEYHEKLHKALYWLVFSRRPMTMEEIAEAMVSGPDCSNNWDENSKLNDPRDVLEVLGSLVMVTSSAMQKSHPITTHNFVDSKEDGETSSPSECSSDESEHHKLHDTRGKKKQLHSNELSLMLRKGAEELVQIGEKTVQFDRPEYAFPQIVTLAHASVQDYLLSQRIRCSSVASFAVDTAIANSYIMRSCLAYLLQLSHLKLAGAYSPGSGPLKDYACTYWFAHGSGILKDPDAQIATLRLLVKDAAVQEWIDFPNQTIPRYAYEVVLFSKRLPLPYAANDMGYQIIMQTLSGHDPAEYHLRAWSRRWPYALRDDGPVGRIAIDRIEELDITPGDGKVLLYAAAASNNNQLLTLLLDRGCNPNAFFEPDATALHVAAHHGHIDCVRTILTFQAELNARNANLETPLFVSSENNHEEVVFALIRAGASIGDETIYHWNALYVAAIKGHLNTVQHLVDAGANINWKTDSGETALSGAAWHQHHRIVDFLLQRQALSEHSADQRAKVLHDLISCGHIYLLQKFLDYGAEINSPDANGDTPLHIAADDCSRIDVMRVLLARGADIFYKNKRGENALFTAVRASNMEAMGLLLAAGIDIDSINDSDETALELASDHGYAQTVQYLIDCGASAVNLNIIPFTRNQNTDMVRTLIERGANRQRIGYNYGRIALHWAADYGFMDLVQLLALDQSDVGYEDDDGKTPAYYAAIQGHTSVVEYLQSKGARLPADAIVSQELVNLRNWRPV